MKLLKIILSVGLLSLTLQAKQNKCFKYDAKDFTLKRIIYNKNGDREVVKSLKPSHINIYFFKDRSSTKPITLEYGVAKEKNAYAYLYCDEKVKRKNGITWCGIECDGGGFNLKKDFSLKVDYALRVSGEPEDDTIPEVELKQNNKKKYLKGIEFKCPKKIPRADIIDEKYYKDSPKGKYVCYDYKEKSKYIGCFRSLKSCRDLHLQHFGKYSSKQSTKEALKRCKKSTPNSKFVDNAKGLYVCYDSKDIYNMYNGCFRSLTSCKSKHKKHFGKYPTQFQSKKAFRRCMESKPKKR